MAQICTTRCIELAKTLELHVDSNACELIQEGRLIEAGTLKAAFTELEERFRDSGCVLVPPAQTSILQDPDGIAYDYGGEVAAWMNKLHTAQTVIFCIHSFGPPQHYTYLEISQDLMNPIKKLVIYKDPLTISSFSATS